MALSDHIVELAGVKQSGTTRLADGTGQNNEGKTLRKDPQAWRRTS